MKRQEIEATLAAAYPIDRERIQRLDIESLEAELLADIDELGEHDGLLPGAGVTPPDRPRGWRSGSRRLGLGVAVAALAVAVVVVALLAGGGDERPSSAYGAELVRFAESSPLLLVEAPKWGIRNVGHLRSTQGYINFTEEAPEPHPDEALETRAETKRHETPPAVIARALRFMELTWRDGSQSKIRFHEGRLSVSLYSPYMHKVVWAEMPGRSIKTTIPALGVTAYVDPRTERSWRQGGPGHRSMVAVWKEGGRLIELRAHVPNLAAFRERLGWLRRVSAEEWLDAMPPRIVKSVDYVATVEAMLEGIPQPPGFDPTTLEGAEVTTDRYQVGAAVGGAVACSWFRAWGEALGSGDTATAEKAEAVLLGSGSWPIFKEMAKEGAYPATVIEYAKAMPSLHWYHRPLLPQVNKGLCSTTGYPAIVEAG
jgi:hypothetical protein